jgi:predicted RND superfamily exporter protein
MMAHHQGIYGLGLLLTLGSVTSLIAALIVLPVLLRLWHRPPATPARPPEERAETVRVP